MNPIDRPQHPAQCTDPSDKCIDRLEREGFEARLQEAKAAYKARHGYGAPPEWAGRHRARFDAWRVARAHNPALRFADWVRTYREQVARDASGQSDDLAPLEWSP